VRLLALQELEEVIDDIGGKGFGRQFRCLNEPLAGTVLAPIKFGNPVEGRHLYGIKLRSNFLASRFTSRHTIRSRLLLPFLLYALLASSQFALGK